MDFPGGSVGTESACNAGALGGEDPLEKGTAPHSSILAWEIPWTEEPGGLQSMGPQGVRRDSVAKPPPQRETLYAFNTIKTTSSCEIRDLSFIKIVNPLTLFNCLKTNSSGAI